MSVGKSAYKVAKGGFVVYNLGEEYKNSFFYSVSKKLKNNDTLSFSVGLASLKKQTVMPHQLHFYLHIHIFFRTVF